MVTLLIRTGRPVLLVPHMGRVPFTVVATEILGSGGAIAAAAAPPTIPQAVACGDEFADRGLYLKHVEGG